MSMRPAREPMKPDDTPSEYSEAEIEAASSDELAEEAQLLLDARLRRMMALNIEVRRRDAQIEVMKRQIQELKEALSAKSGDVEFEAEWKTEEPEEVIDGEVVDVGS